MTPDTSGPTLRVPLAHYDPDSSSWRTSGVMFPSDWPTSSETCPAWGMTRAGELFELPTPALPTDVPASSSLLLLTPTMGDGKGGGRTDPGVRGIDRDGSGGLREQVRTLLPTPTASDTNGSGAHGDGGMDLRTTIELLPTPLASDGEEEWDAWTARMQARHGNGNEHGASLSIEALRLLLTPRASDGPDKTSHARSWSTTDRNLHTLVKLGELTSGSTDQPSPAGNTSSDEPHPTPPSPDATDDPDCLPFSSSG